MNNRSHSHAVICSALLLAVWCGCGDEDGDGSLRVEIRCSSESTNGNNCPANHSDEETWTLAGNDGEETFDLTIRARGVVEQKTYNGVGDQDGLWGAGGTPADTNWNTFRLEVSSPPATYHLNVGMSGTEHSWLLDVTKTIVANSGATLTLYGDAGDDDLAVLNQDSAPWGTPLVVPDIPPAPSSFDGQFVQVDILSIGVQ